MPHSKARSDQVSPSRLQTLDPHHAPGIRPRPAQRLLHEDTDPQRRQEGSHPGAATALTGPAGHSSRAEGKRVPGPRV